MSAVDFSETTAERIDSTVRELDRQLAQEGPYAPEWSSRLKDLLGDAVCRQLGIYELPEDFVLSIVIPVYNEEKTLRDLVERVAAVPIRKEIILVDDCSRDCSLTVMQLLTEELQDENTRVVTERHEVNRGK